MVIVSYCNEPPASRRNEPLVIGFPESSETVKSLRNARTLPVSILGSYYDCICSKYLNAILIPMCFGFSLTFKKSMNLNRTVSLAGY